MPQKNDSPPASKPSIKASRALPSSLIQRCRELRRSETEAEHLLWMLLRNRQLFGFKFRRQHPVEGYILDFYCHEAQVAVEVDGAGHLESPQEAYDERRTRILEEAGIRVRRFWNNDVTENPQGILEAIADCLNPEASSP